jgi:DNA repair protein RAD50
LKQILDLHTKVKRFGEARRSQERESILIELEEFSQKMADLESGQRVLLEQLDQTKEEISREELTMRNWSDNLNLRQLIQDKDKKDHEFSQLGHQVGDLNEEDLRRKQSSLNEKQERLDREYYHAKGSFQELTASIAGYERQLAEPDFKNAAVKYTEVLIKHKTTKIATVDLDKYAKALDSAVMKYHQVKMQEVNKLIRELWHNTYKGTDIDTIEIRTEEGDNSTATRKTYNYRVIMLKDNVEMDMKGRCSAGQKVLASIIIRLALAETFCLNCGIFSLDEPTTNLDRENICSLAESLVHMIRSRSQQQNFQFLIITHDMDFVELLGAAQIADKFYSVKRGQDDSLSMIQCKDFSQLDDR